MKASRFLSVFLTICILFSLLLVNAGASFELVDSKNWQNLTDAEADVLLSGAASGNGESFIMVFYRDSCYNSQSAIPEFLSFAKNNDLKLCGINETDYPNWNTWMYFVEEGKKSISFPFLIVYNSPKDILLSADYILTGNEFKNLLEDASLLSSANNNNDIFTDIPKNSRYYEAVKHLSEKNILNGYDDGSFGPQKSITRAEAAAVIVRAANLELKTFQTGFSDVPYEHWSAQYVSAAVNAGIINGMGDGTFAPNSNLTRQQILKMLVCMIGKQDMAESAGGWPVGYVFAASRSGIISPDEFSQLCSDSFGGAPATRGEVAQYVYNTIKNTGAENQYPDNSGESEIVYDNQEENKDVLRIAGKSYSLGMAADNLGSPDEVVPSVFDFDWHIYGTDTYESFFAAGVADNQIVALCAVGKGFSYNGFCAGDFADYNIDEKLLTDKNDNGKIHGFLHISPYYKSTEKSGNNLSGEEVMNFHCTNAFRCFHGLSPLKWSDAAAASARLHSKDMADNNYFDHTSQDGRTPGNRMDAQGIDWGYYAENISAGRRTGAENYNGWVNSAGHRCNILGNAAYLGVGGAYNANSTYKYYFTQNFYR